MSVMQFITGKNETLRDLAFVIGSPVALGLGKKVEIDHREYEILSINPIVSTNKNLDWNGDNALMAYYTGQALGLMSKYGHDILSDAGQDLAREIASLILFARSCGASEAVGAPHKVEQSITYQIHVVEVD